VCDYDRYFASLWCCDVDFLLRARGVFWEHGMFCEALENPTGVEDHVSFPPG
jgi:hypothetical protein